MHHLFVFGCVLSLAVRRGTHPPTSAAAVLARARKMICVRLILSIFALLPRVPYMICRALTLLIVLSLFALFMQESRER